MGDQISLQMPDVSSKIFMEHPSAVHLTRHRGNYEQSRHSFAVMKFSSLEETDIYRNKHTHIKACTYTCEVTSVRECQVVPGGHMSMGTDWPGGQGRLLGGRDG